MREVKPTEGSVGASKIPWKLILEDLELPSCPSLELVFSGLIILQKDLWIFLVTSIIVFELLDALVVVNKVMGWHF